MRMQYNYFIVKWIFSLALLHRYLHLSQSDHACMPKMKNVILTQDQWNVFILHMCHWNKNGNWEKNLQYELCLLARSLQYGHLIVHRFDRREREMHWHELCMYKCRWWHEYVQRVVKGERVSVCERERTMYVWKANKEKKNKSIDRKSRDKMCPPNASTRAIINDLRIFP